MEHNKDNVPEWANTTNPNIHSRHDPIELAHIYYRLEKLESTLERMEPKISELVTLLERSKGVIWVLTKLSLIAVGGWAFIQWAKQHIKF